MEILSPRCAAIDVHKRTAVAAVGWVDAQGRRHRQVRTDATMTADIERLRQWFTEHGVTHVAMESTGVYWKPLFNLLEDRFTLLLANAQHIKATLADYPHRQHGLSGRDGHGHRPGASALRPDPPAG